MDSMNTGLLTLQICLLHILTATETNPRVMIVIQSCLKTTVNHPVEKAREKKKKAEYEYDGKERESPYTLYIYADQNPAAHRASGSCHQGVEEHDRRLFAVLGRLSEVGLTVNGDKCKFRLSKLIFYGHELSSDGGSPSQEKIANIRDARSPKDASEDRSFMGLVQYSAKFIPDLASITRPIQDLTRKGVPFVWGAEQQKAFQELKRLITQAETLAYYQVGCRTRIVANALPVGLGVVVTLQQGGVWRVISYASRSLNDVERRYNQTEKAGGSSLSLGVRKVQHGYDFKLVYRPGKTNVTDALSRLNSVKQSDTGQEYYSVRAIVENCIPVALSAIEIEKASYNDAELSQVKGCVRTGNWERCTSPSHPHIEDELCIYGEILLRGSSIVVLKALRDSLVAGHG
ncbi:PREDICTED: uncharacterized protein LOC107353811 [Acropora digitifera]|uniref:uncharacterized protein LOC107353811 n=1 Tax=Acropora digitifera TaxID=70779 RepID=UPI00077AB786|nr:PREDICTED: uncharacterized protein LOC107353811 [Acropora digitifera]